MSPLRGCLSSPVQLRPPLIPRPSLLGLLLLELLVLLLEEEEQQLSGSPGTSSSTLPADDQPGTENESGEGGPVHDQPVCTTSPEPMGSRDSAEEPDRHFLVVCFLITTVLGASSFVFQTITALWLCIAQRQEIRCKDETRCKNKTETTEMWYWVFLWALFSSLFVHGAAGVLMFVMLQRHKQGRLISVVLISIGFLASVTGAMITSAAVAGIYQVAGKNMAPLEALVFGVGQTVLTVIISFSRVIATL